ncbi:hypothetical protein F5883DRAFT_644169 [Diaporthe sp. PMI_573]|nr:hypothetical protein F5883DRAFT_671917 [Diaporthaceae sp. PMI_573]KAH8768391.1 hypothetical protein F5883DRAFT_644169 [Diaporthaceae sp. PMI_573]
MVNLARDYIDILLCLGENDQTRPAGASEIESDDTPSESLRPNETEIGNSQEHGRATEAIDFEHEGAFIHSETFDSVNAGDSAGEAATASNGENDSVITAPIQIVEADKDNVLLNAPTLLKQPFSIRISLAQLTAEGRGIYAGLVMVEGKCVEFDNSQNAPIYDPLDFNMFLERIPHGKIALLQSYRMQAHDTFRRWFITVQEGDRKPTTPQSVETQCLHGFTVALEMRAKAHGKSVALTTAEIAKSVARSS